MSNPILNGPQAAESNPPIEPQFFKPSVFPIFTISRGPTTTVTMLSAFGVDNNYAVGQKVRFLIPPSHGMQQINQQTAQVIGRPAINQITVDIDSRFYDVFIISPAYGLTPPQVIAIGDVNSGLISTNGRNNATTTVPGSFVNTSPFASG